MYLYPYIPSVQAQRRTGGTGLGLYSLAKRLESLGGNCGVEGRSDGATGSCFWVSIPFRPDDSVGEGVHVSGDVKGVERSVITLPPESTGGGIECLMSGFIRQDESCDVALHRCANARP